MAFYLTWRSLLFIILVYDVLSSITAASTPLKPDKGRCNSDAECLENEFCGGRSKTRCEECFDCSKLLRHSKRGIDGNACARNSQECGECLDGYMDWSGTCERAPGWIEGKIETFAERIPEAPEKAEGTLMNIWWIVGIGGIVAMAGIVTLGFKYIKGRKCPVPLLTAKRGPMRVLGHGNFNDQQSDPLTGYEYNGPYDHPPTAPEEYQLPPPYSRYMDPSQQSSTNPVTQASMQQAGVFEFDEAALRANRRTNQYVRVDRREVAPETEMPSGRGEGVGGPIHNSRVRPLLPDEVDGGRRSRSRRHRTPSQEQPVDNGNADNHQAMENNNLPLQNFAFMNMENRLPENPGIHGVGAGYNRDPVVGQVELAFYLRVGTGRPRNHSGPGYGLFNQGTNTVSPLTAPPSPAGQIDATHLNLCNLTGNFQPSRESLDSGTGTSEEHDRSVARSISVAQLSDWGEVSMFDDYAPLSPPEHPPVPDFQDPGGYAVPQQMELHDLGNLEEAEMLDFQEEDDQEE